jgi:hypothetical protein
MYKVNRWYVETTKYSITLSCGTPWTENEAEMDLLTVRSQDVK